MENEHKRLFFGAQTIAAWPKDLPGGRIIPEETRHITLAFLGNVSFPDLTDCPRPTFLIGSAGQCSQLVFLPDKEHPRVVAGEALFFDENGLNAYQQQLQLWLESLGYKVDKRQFYPHLTIARAPFSVEEWKKVPCPIPFYIKAIHLYESMGNLTYIPRWTVQITSPFEEIEHTADIAFKIRGKTFEQLFVHGVWALAFKFPAVLSQFHEQKPASLDDVIIELNNLICRLDISVGSPFKAVSFHDHLTSGEWLEWEMVIDV